MAKRYRSVGMGGTFDHFHRGHQHFIEHAWQLGDELIIGVTSEKLVKHKPWARSIQSFDERLRQVRRFCQQKHIKAELFELTDGIGPTVEKSRVQALCVTPETEAGADKINTLRTRLRMRPLPAYVATYWRTESGEVLHSAAIREGRLGRNGEEWWKVFSQALVINDTQRQQLSAPQGEIVTKPHRGTITVVVGDTSLLHFHQQKWPYHLGIFDLKTQRQPVIDPWLLSLSSSSIQVDNPAGQITLDLVNACQRLLPSEDLVKQLISSPAHLQVSGEEDLAAVVWGIMLPLGSHVYYGQPGAGMIELVVTEELKGRLTELLSQRPLP